MMRRWIAIGFVALFIVALRILWPLLTPLSLALLLTYILIPLVDRVERRTRWPRTGAAAFVYLLLLVILSSLPALVVPYVVAQVQTLGPILSRGVTQFGGFLEEFGTPVILGQELNPYELYLEFSSSLLSLGTQLASSSVNVLFGFAATFFSSVLWLLFVLVISFYIVRDSPNISYYLWSLVPREARLDAYYLVRRIDRTWHAFLRGQLLLSTAIFLMTTTVLVILGVPQAFSLGLLAGVLNIIPNLGPIFSAIPAIILALVQGSNHFALTPLLFALIVTGAYILIQQVESNVLVPRIIGGSVRLHPAVVLLGALIGLTLIGIFGIFLAAPTLASLRVVTGYAYRKLLDPSFQPVGVALPAHLATIPDPRERPIVPVPFPTTDSELPGWRAWLRRLPIPSSKDTHDS